MEIVTLGLGLALALLGERWRYGRQLIGLAKTGLDMTRGTSLDKLPPNVRQLVEQAIIAANLREAEALAKKLTEMEAQGKLDAAAAYERGKRNAEGMQTEVVDRTGDESWSKPFKK